MTLRLTWIALPAAALAVYVWTASSSQQTSLPATEDDAVALLIRLGVSDTAPTVWDGDMAVSGDARPTHSPFMTPVWPFSLRVIRTAPNAASSESLLRAVASR